MRLNLLLYTPLQLLFKSKEASSGLFLHSGAYKKGIILVFICPKITSCVKNELVCMQNRKKGRIKGACLFLLYAPCFFFSQQGRINALFFAIYMPVSLFSCSQRAEVSLRAECREDFQLICGRFRGQSVNNVLRNPFEGLELRRHIAIVTQLPCAK